jgi:hypothetical protein
MHYHKNVEAQHLHVHKVFVLVAYRGRLISAAFGKFQLLLLNFCPGRNVDAS